MKYLMMFFFAMCFTTMMYSQDSTKTTAAIRQKYLEKSNNHRAVSLTMFAIGITAVTIVLPTTESLEAAVNSIAVGMAAGIAGIILYMASIRNRRKVKSLSTNFRIDKRTIPEGGNINYTPTVSVRIAL